jgi:glycosyltransferase involved in cell wall biosynthesis
VVGFAKQENTKVKLLFIVHAPWRADIGISAVLIAIAEEMVKSGVSVNVYDLETAYPRKTWLNGKLGGPFFRFMAERYVRRTADRYDVIVFEQGKLTCVPPARRCILVAHSSGLMHLHLRAQKSHHPGTRKRQSIRSRLLSVVAKFLDGGVTSVEKSFDLADIILVLNETEREFVARNAKWASKAVAIPNCLADDRFNELGLVNYDSTLSLLAPVIVYVGRWDTLKGIGDIPAIFGNIRQHFPDARLRLLGGGVSKDEVLRGFPREVHSEIQIVETFQPMELPALLEGGTVGIFPSRTEGFGLVVLEMLAGGIPVVSYDIPGPREMLSQVDSALLCDPFSVASMSSGVLRVLQIAESELLQLREAARGCAALYTASCVAQRWLHVLNEYSGKSRQMPTEFRAEPN